MIKNKRYFTRDNVDPELKDVSLWATVDASLISDKDASRFRKREKAVLAYLADDPVAEICKDFKISRPELVRIVKRCLETHPDGRIWGFRALIPYTRQKLPEETVMDRDRSTQKKSSLELTQLFYQFPEVKELVDILFLKKHKKGVVHESRIPLMSIHKRFLGKCREVGIKADSYPFTAKQLGKTSLWKYLNKLFNSEQKPATLARIGTDAARSLKFNGTESLDKELVIRPYQRVEFDAHLIDAFCTIKVPSVYGGFVYLVLDRIWLLVIIDVLTRAVLGYHLSFKKQYTQDDVLLCVSNSVKPWQPKNLTIPKLKYPEQGGFPSSSLSELEWAVWDEIAYDNAKSHLSWRVRERLTSVINCAINVGPVQTPEHRPFIERFFCTLEENGFHRLPSTTGSNINDSRRDVPEKKALRYNISLQHIEELTDVMIAQYNGTPHSGLGYRSPLECLKYYINSDGVPPRQLSNQQRNNLKLLNIQFTRTVRKGNGRPHINFKGVRYKNDVLSRSPDLVGTKLILIVNPSDIRSIIAILPNGAEFGVLCAQGLWGRSMHNLEMREAILALKNEKLIWYTESDDPVQIYLDYLGEQSLKSKNARRKLVSAQQNQKLNRADHFDNEVVEISPESFRLRKNQSVKMTDTKNINSLPKLKTITF